jgi:hypothetical protein
MTSATTTAPSPTHPAPTLTEERTWRSGYTPKTYEEVGAVLDSLGPGVNFCVYDTKGEPSDPPRGVWIRHHDDNGFRELLVPNDQEGRHKLRFTRRAFVRAEGDEDGVLIEHEDGSTAAIRRASFEEVAELALEELEKAIPQAEATLRECEEATA